MIAEENQKPGSASEAPEDKENKPEVLEEPREEAGEKVREEDKPIPTEQVETIREEIVSGEKKEEAETKEQASAAGEKKWYVIQTFSGQEEKVKKSLEHSIQELNMGHRIFRVLVPEEEIVEIRGKKRVELKKKMFPGYIFIEMILDDESWYVIRSIPGVAKFIGTKIKPTPVLDREMQRVLKQIGIKGEKLEINFEIGETVRVISGPFRGYTGTINEINADKGKLKVLINIFGRDTPVETNFEHAQKIV